MESKKRVLVIDDEQDICYAIQRTLGRSGYEVLTAGDGLEGLAMVRAHDPDLIILDVRMPKKDGYNVLAELMGDPFTNHIPIMMLSGLSEIEEVIIGLRRGADDYVTKPFHPDELRARVGNLIARSRNFLCPSRHA